MRRLRHRLRPKRGNCCMFCSYGDAPCPSVQEPRVTGMALVVAQRPCRRSTTGSPCIGRSSPSTSGLRVVSCSLQQTFVNHEEELGGRAKELHPDELSAAIKPPFAD